MVPYPSSPAPDPKRSRRRISVSTLGARAVVSRKLARRRRPHALFAPPDLILLGDLPDHDPAPAAGRRGLAPPPIIPEFSIRDRAKTPDRKNPLRDSMQDADRSTLCPVERRRLSCFDMISKRAWVPRMLASL